MLERIGIYCAAHCLTSAQLSFVSFVKTFVFFVSQ
jgi:hypothetical protein